MRRKCFLLCLIPALALNAAFSACSKAGGDEGVKGSHINAVDIDGSTNYRFLFREEIDRERMNKQVTDEEYFRQK